MGRARRLARRAREVLAGLAEELGKHVASGHGLLAAPVPAEPWEPGMREWFRSTLEWIAETTARWSAGPEQATREKP